MSLSKISPDDPKLTAYALGELAGEERTAFEAALREDVAAQAAVEAIRAMAARLEFALAAEPMVPPAPAAKELLAAGPYAKKARLLKFPQLYYLAGGLAAACFAVIVALNPASHRVREARYQEVSLIGAANEKKRAEVEADLAKDTAAMPLEPPASASVAGAAGVEQARKRDVRDKVESGLKERQRIDAQGGAVVKMQLSSRAMASWSPGVHKDEAGSAGFLKEAAAPAPTTVPNTEAYAYRRDNDFLRAAENPLSTFSIDVDTASYSNVRRFLDGGLVPPPDAVRVEELVNYFPYHYAPPAGGVPFAASMEVADAPWAPTHRLVRIGLKGREVTTSQRPVANLVFLLDVSGSMNEPNKLPLVKESMRLLVSKLRPDDRVAIVVYAGASGLALPSTPVARSHEILAALDELSPGGSTNGAMGLHLAYDIAKANFVAGGVNRVILCTDGDFNVGVTNDGELIRLVTEKAKSGVFLTALGFGMGNYKDATLEQLADKGNGNYGYIDTRREAEKLLVEQVNGTLVTIAKDVKLQVEFNPAQVASYRLIGYENRMLNKEDFNNDKIDAGEIGAGHTVTALYEVVPVGAEGEGQAESRVGAVDELRYRIAGAGNRKTQAGDERENASRGSAELLTLKVRYKEPSAEVSRKLEFPLVDAKRGFAEASADFKFAAAVAEFGMILRDSPHKGAGTMKDVIAWAEAGINSDVGGYRGEFISLARRVDLIVQ
ncbi:MAG: von Willebrand factor [Verrucomicrobia bacterium]|nr:von Willebrand factor [Verrucomicrobiota bacterium]